jgi:hypothetical protein
MRLAIPVAGGSVIRGFAPQLIIVRRKAGHA